VVELAAQLRVDVDIDLAQTFQDLAEDMLGVDFGELRFDASGVLQIVGGAAGPDLGGLRLAVQGVAGRLAGRVDLGLPGAGLPELIAHLTAQLGSVRALFPELDVPDRIGLDGLGLRVGAVRAAIESGPLAGLLGLVPGLRWPDTLGRIGGDLGGLVELLRVLAGLLATAAASRSLVERTARFATLLDVEAAKAAGGTLGTLSADTGLVAAIRTADPGDLELVDRLGRRVVTFLDAVLEVGDRWSAGMGYGQAALLGVDVTGSAAALELARLALDGADLQAVAGLVAEIRAGAAPLLDLPLPDAPAEAAGVVDQSLALVGQLTAAVRSWDVAATMEPIRDLAGFALAPVAALQQAMEAVSVALTGAIRGVRALVDEVDLTPVATAVRVALQPVVDVLDAVAAEIAAAEQVLTEVAGNVTTALGTVKGFVEDAAGAVTSALGTARQTLAALHLEELGARLGDALRAVAAALASAQLSPYFDAAIDVIDTAADVVYAVPFGLLPTDVQQEIVDACRPIKELELQPVEDALRAELAEIRGSFRADALAALEAAYRAVVDFLVSLDPAPHLRELEVGALAELRGIVAEIDPGELLAPVEAALAELRGLLDGVDLEHELLTPLEELFTPVLAALDELDPAGLLAPARAEVDRARESVVELLHLDDATAALQAFGRGAAGALGRIDASRLAEVLDEQVVAALAQLPEGPPGGPFGSLLVSVAQASGFQADEPAVRDVIAWVRGDEGGGGVVRSRMQRSAGHVDAVREAVRALDPAPLAAAAAGQHRALTAAVTAHPAGSPLRVALQALLDGVRPAEVLAPLPDNRRRYLITLDADATLLGTLAGSGRSEVTDAAGRLRVALEPLAAFPARLRALLEALGLDPGGRSMSEVLADLLTEAGPGRLVPALADLVGAMRDKLLAALDIVVGSGLDAVAAVEGVLAAIDLGPVVDELAALHTQVRDEVAKLTPRALLGDVVTAADDVVDRLAQFDPLAPVREVVDATRAAALAVLETARPTVVFRPVVDLHADVVRIAGGLDVVALLGPVLDALDGLAVQLDDGFDRTGDSLARLQDALPSEVTSTDLGASIGVAVDVGVSL